MSGATILFLSQYPSSNAIVAAQLGGVERYAAACGWSVNMVSVSSAFRKNIGEALRRFRPAGCIVYCCGDNVDFCAANYGGLPVVFSDLPDCLQGTGLPFVALDNAAIAHAAFRELSSAHPTAYAFIGGRWNRMWSRVRERVFKALALAADVPFHGFPYRRESDDARIARLHDFVRGLPRRTGVFCATDLTAADVADFAIEEGVKIPRDLMFVGVNDIEPLWKPHVPPISSVRLDFDRIGYEAARILGEIMAERSGGASRRRRDSAVATESFIGPLLVERRESTRGSGIRRPRIAEAVQIIRREACNGLTAAALAARFPGSRWLFEMRFREAMGHSPLDEISNVRLERAVSMLSRRDVAIGAIADFCGFRSSAALHKAFRARYGVSMRAWRKKHQDE